MEWYEDEVRSLELFQSEHTAPINSILFYGSSSFRLWDTLEKDFSGAPVINRAFGGSTLAACVYFFERLIPPCQPGALIFYAGDNDLGDGNAPDYVLNSFCNLKDKIRRYLPGVPFAFVSIKPSPSRWDIIDRIKLVNEFVKSELSTWPEASYIDIFQEMLGADGRPVREYFAEDGLHLSPQGYCLWTQLINRWEPLGGYVALKED